VICLAVKLNGQAIALAGVSGDGVLTATLWRRQFSDAEGAPADVGFDIGGLVGDAHLRWAKRELQVGDHLEIAVVEAEQCDVPAKEKRDDAALKEQVERRQYEHLKRKYEKA